MRDFNHTIGVLVKAYLNDTLRHDNCYACAVGNMMADSCGFKFEVINNVFFDDSDLKLKWVGLDSIYDKELDIKTQQQPENWMNVFYGGDVVCQDYKGEAIKIIESTGYTVMELLKVERAFERSPVGYSKDEHMFNGLMAVVDVLAEIHNIDLTTREETKKLFVKA